MFLLRLILVCVGDIVVVWRKGWLVRRSDYTCAIVRTGLVINCNGGFGIVLMCSGTVFLQVGNESSGSAKEVNVKHEGIITHIHIYTKYISISNTYIQYICISIISNIYTGERGQFEIVYN